MPSAANGLSRSWFRLTGACMTSVPLLLFFGLGLAAGAWRAGRRDRSIAKAAAGLPILLLLLTVGVFAGVVFSRGTGNNMADLGIIAAVSVGSLSAAYAMVGGLIGALLRRRLEQKR
jgi:Ca2+/H+ antiporter